MFRCLNKYKNNLWKALNFQYWTISSLVGDDIGINKVKGCCISMCLSWRIHFKAMQGMRSIIVNKNVI